MSSARGVPSSATARSSAATSSTSSTPRRSLPAKAKDAPFAVAADVPSGLSAQTGAAARPTFAADATVTMLAYKPGLVASAGAPWVGAVKLAKLGVDASKYLEAEERA